VSVPLALPPLGVWGDCHPSRIAQPCWWDDLAELGATTAALFLDSSKAAWDLRWTEQQAREACRLAIERDLEAILTAWPLPQKAQIDAMIADLRRLLPLGAVALEVELEHLWLLEHLDRANFSSMRVAGEYLLERLFLLCEPLDIRVEVTTHLGHPESGQHALITPRVHRANMQLYSTRHDWLKRLVRWASRLAPGRRQVDGVRRFAGVEGLGDGVPLLGLGLAGYDQHWPGHSITEALDLALESALTEAAALRLAVSLVMIWSSKWLFGHLADRPGQAEVVEWIRARWGQ